MISVPRAQFRFVRGSPTRLSSTAKCTRSFFPGCGRQSTFEHEDFTDETDVTTCSLDRPEQLPPNDHTRASSKLDWMKLADDLLHYCEARSK